mmetsp:Transcript_20507/g.38981  ORF Transcript_20507/g.38981 Transcript_20507/m.38981 type:complete len:708 (+) Transcript_20507:136-2259(+)
MTSWGAPLGVRTGNSVEVFGVSQKPWRSALRRTCLDPDPSMEDGEFYSRNHRVKSEAFRRVMMNGTVGGGLEAVEGVRDWLTDVEKEMASHGLRSPLSHTQRSLIALEPEAADQSTGPCRAVVRNSADLIKHASQGWVEVNLTRMDLDEVRGLARHLQGSARRTLYTLKMKVHNGQARIQLLRKPRGLAAQAAAQSARAQASKTLQSPEVQSSMARALGSLLQTTTQLNILEMCVDPGMAIMKSLAQGLGLNCTLRCLSFKGAAIGDELFEELARGLVRNTSLQVLLVQGCQLTDKAIHWINIMLKHHSVRASTKSWEVSLRRFPGDDDDCGAAERLQHQQQSSVGLVKLDLSDNQLTFRGIKVLSCTLRMMDNRLKYLGLRRNNLGHTTFALLRSLVNQTPRLQIVDVRDNRDPAVDVLRAPAHKACAIHHSTQKGVAGRRVQVVSFSTTDAVHDDRPPTRVPELNLTPEALCVDPLSDPSIAGPLADSACVTGVVQSDASAQVATDQSRCEDPRQSQRNDGFLIAPRQERLRRADVDDGETVPDGASTACLDVGELDNRHASETDNVHQDQRGRVQQEASSDECLPEVSANTVPVKRVCLASNIGAAGRTIDTEAGDVHMKLALELRGRCLAGVGASNQLEAEISQLTTDLRYLERLVDEMESTSKLGAHGDKVRGGTSPPNQCDDMEGVAATVAHQLRRLYYLY